MISSNILSTLESSSFSALYAESYISSQVEHIICLLLEYAFINKDKIFTFDLSSVSSLYHQRILEKLKTRLRISSVYTDYGKLFIDWSL